MGSQSSPEALASRVDVLAIRVLSSYTDPVMGALRASVLRAALGESSPRRPNNPKGVNHVVIFERTSHHQNCTNSDQAKEQMPTPATFTNPLLTEFPPEAIEEAFGNNQGIPQSGTIF